MRTFFALVAFASVLLGGCQTTEQRLARLHTGMTRSEVIYLLGSPRTVAHNGAMEVLDFDLARQREDGQQSVSNRYYVIFGRDRRVESFGPN